MFENLVGNTFAILAGIAAVFSLMWLRRQLEGKRNRAAIQGALADFEEIIGGALWRGRDADVLASDRLDNLKEPGPVRYEHICRTKLGAWFIFVVEVHSGRILFRELYPCDEATAKLRLQRHPLAYVRCFGQPAVA